MKHYQAYSTKYGKRTEPTPRAAAQAFFAAFPGARKCEILEGVVDGPYFTVAYSRGATPRKWEDVTRKTLDQIDQLT